MGTFTPKTKKREFLSFFEETQVETSGYGILTGKPTDLSIHFYTSVLSDPRLREDGRVHFRLGPEQPEISRFLVGRGEPAGWAACESSGLARGVAGSWDRGACGRLAGRAGVAAAAVGRVPARRPRGQCLRPGPERAPGGVGPLVRVPEPEPGVPELVACCAPRGSDDIAPHRPWALHGARAILGALSPCALASQCLFKGSPGCTDGPALDGPIESGSKVLGLSSAPSCPTLGLTPATPPVTPSSSL